LKYLVFNRKGSQMLSPKNGSGFSPDSSPTPSQEVWERGTIASLAELPAVVERLEASLNSRAYLPPDLLAVRFALEEAVANALGQGGGVPSEPIQVGYLVTRDQVIVEVCGRGPGFHPLSGPDPPAPEYRGLAGGWGLQLMRDYLTWLRFNREGNCVTMCRRRWGP
jgi:anti-sigma regulatory factor (Ser/Thr protein kinase)